jgi:hypothetical protein
MGMQMLFVIQHDQRNQSHTPPSMLNNAQINDTNNQSKEAIILKFPSSLASLKP